MSKRSVLLSHMDELTEEINKFIESMPYQLPDNPKHRIILEAHVNRILQDKVVNGKMDQHFFNYVIKKLREIGFYEIFNSNPRFEERRQILRRMIVNEYNNHN